MLLRTITFLGPVYEIYTSYRKLQVVFQCIVLLYRIMLDESPPNRPPLSRGESLPAGAEGGLNVGKDKPLRTSSFDTAALYSKQGSITTTNGRLSSVPVPIVN